MSALAIEFEEICYANASPELIIRDFQGPMIGPEILGYDFKRIVKNFQERKSELDFRHFEDISIFTTEVESFYRRLICFYYVTMSLNHYKKDYRSGKFNLYVNRFITHYGSKFKILIYELSRYSHESSKIAMQNLFAVDEVPNLEDSIAQIKTLADLDYNDLIPSSNDYFNFLECRYITFERLRKETETEEVFLTEFLQLLKDFVSVCENKYTKQENIITQYQIDSISEKSYWEIQQLKASEENPKLILHYNLRLVKLVDEGVNDAINFVLEAPKLQKMYLENDYEGFFWTLNTIIGIEFIGSDGVNPNGNRVLESLKTQIFEPEVRLEKIKRKITLEISNEIKEEVNRLKNSGNCVEVESAQKFDEIILEIEKAGGVSQFWFNSISGGNILSHKIHHGKNKDGFNFLSCALISLSGPYRVAIDRKTNEIIFVGNYHLG
jgi:hypothetical protein